LVIDILKVNNLSYYLLSLIDSNNYFNILNHVSAFS